MFTLNTALLLSKKNLQVDILCLSNSRLEKEAASSGLKTFPVLSDSYFNFFSIKKISKIISFEKYDLVHCHASKDLWIIVPALQLNYIKSPLLLTKHVGSFIKKKDFLHRYIYKRVDLALAISSIIKKNLLDTTPLSENKITLLHNYVDTTKFNPLCFNPKIFRNEFSINENEILIGMMARISPGKGHEEFLFAAKELNKVFKNLKFVIVGEASQGEDVYASSIKKIIETLSLNNVILTGFRKDTPAILSSMDIFVFPSHAEAFGIALIEAMAMEKATVCSNSDGVLDIAIDGETSLLFEKKNAEDLISKLKTLIQSKELRDKLGTNGRKRVVKEFDSEIIIEKTIRIYKNSIKKKLSTID